MNPIPFIDINFDEFKTARDNLRDLTLELDNLTTSKINGHMDNVKSAWSDKGADLFLKKEEELSCEFIELSKDINALLDEIEEKAWMIFDAELFSKGLAIYRNYF